MLDAAGARRQHRRRREPRADRHPASVDRFSYLLKNIHPIPPYRQKPYNPPSVTAARRMNRLWCTPSSQRIPLEPRSSRKRLHRSIPMTAGNVFSHRHPRRAKARFPSSGYVPGCNLSLLYHLTNPSVKFSGFFHPLSGYFQSKNGRKFSIMPIFLQKPTTLQKYRSIRCIPVTARIIQKRRADFFERVFPLFLYSSIFPISIRKLRRRFSSFVRQAPPSFRRESPPPFPP